LLNIIFSTTARRYIIEYLREDWEVVRGHHTGAPPSQRPIGVSH